MSIDDLYCFKGSKKSNNPKTFTFQEDQSTPSLSNTFLCDIDSKDEYANVKALS